MAIRNQMAVMLSMRILLNNLKLVAADVVGSGLRDQISWFYGRIYIMFWFLEVYYSEEGFSSDDHPGAAAAGAPSNDDDDEMSRVVEMIREFAVESGDIVVDAFEEIIPKQLHTTTSTNSTSGNDNPAAAAAIGGVLPDLRKQIESIVRLIFNCIHVDARELQRMAHKQTAKRSLRYSKRRVHVEYGLFDVRGFELYARIIAERCIFDLKRRVIAITGEGGTGKTSLAKYVQRIEKPNIDCTGWITVSKAYVLRDLLLGLLKDVTVITEKILEMDERELKNELRKQLRGRDYLIVIDDVWEKEAWDDLIDAFPDNDLNNSRILITTRFPSVASHATGPGDERPFPLPQDLFHIGDPEATDLAERYNRCKNSIMYPNCFELKSLTEEASWMLFRHLYFKQKECRPCDDDELLEAHGRRIVRSCCGLPLVISVVARMLRAIDGRANDGSSWSSIARQINQEPTGDSDRQMNILALCFYMLNRDLQLCLLYLGVFPEDTDIPVEQLMQLWIAEGLIQVPAPEENNANPTLEDVAEERLQALIDIRLIHVSKTSIEWGPKSCRIHDILRDLCIYLSKEGFLGVHTGADHSSTATDDHQTRSKRLSILGNCRDYLCNSINSSSGSYCSHVRSFSSFSQDTRTFSKEDWKSLFQHFKLLRVLNLGEQEAEKKLDDSIGQLIHLRYLKVKPAKHIRVPISAIFNLCHIQTIDLRPASFSKLPVEIWKMQRLRHLYLGGRCSFPKAGRDDRLPNLLTLSYISNDPRAAIHLAEKAPNLRKLGLNRYHCASKEEEEATFELPHLQSLKFAGQCTFKETITLPATITRITVKGALLQSNAIEIFGKLPSLEILKLQTNFVDEKFVVRGKGSFPQLWLLQLANSNIVTWILEEGAMPYLHQVFLNSCSQLLDLPNELWSVSTFMKLALLWCSKELVDNARQCRAIEEMFNEKEGFSLEIYPWEESDTDDDLTGDNDHDDDAVTDDA